ncbi:MAG: hypothetical protein KDH09_17485 [Chrysiogenetes bacterium]|nr:hypothetical protein [Chrysiogenetes bacterium]
MLMWILLGILAVLVLGLAWLLRKRARFDEEIRQSLLALKRRGGAPEEVFSHESLAQHPEPVRRFLTHAIADGARLAGSVDFQMQGEILLNPRGKWQEFTAREVIAGHHGFVWDAQVKAGILSVRGVDAYLEGEGRMRVWVARLFQIIDATSEDISRSTLGRLAAELAWAPAVLYAMEGVSWSAPSDEEVVARFGIENEDIELHLKIDEKGALTELWLDRWSINIDPEGPKYLPFGASVSGEASFGGYTIASVMEGGWNFGNESYAPFIRLTLTQADFR